MLFHTFGNKANKIMILIHGVLTPWQIWQDAINYFSKEYYVIVPVWDGHVEEETSECLSVENEANKIIEYVLKIMIEKFVLCVDYLWVEQQCKF